MGEERKKLIPSLLLFTLVIFLPLSTHAFDASAPNNKVGIHLAQPQEDDIKKAAELVNSSGGKWGYVTLVLQENDRNREKWQAVFDLLRENHLIPIIRLATQPEGAEWKRATAAEAADWVSFLDSLNWVVKDRYVVLFNEPNQGQEWGGAVDASDYAQVADAFAKKLKSSTGDYFVMLAGLDSSAPSAGTSLEDESVFLSQAYVAVPALYDHIDGLSSHSYPNPGFAGSPEAVGRGTIADYEWELDFLRALGVSKDFPVFITETGWSNQAVSPEQIGEDLKTAYSRWMADSRVRAVTPFVLNYQGEPFLKFSWRKYLSDEFYPQFEAVKSIPKVKGDPEQIDRGTIEMSLPQELLVDSNYHFFLPLTNNGQAIWDRDNGYQLRLSTHNFENYFLADIHQIKPGDSDEADIFINTGSKLGKGEGEIGLYKNDKKVLGAATWHFTMLPLPSLHIQANLFPKGKAQGNSFELQVFDQKEQLVFKQKNIHIKDGQGNVQSLRNVYFGGTYRVVLLNPYYLPRQDFVTFHKGTNDLRFKVMLPLDFNRDGTFNWKDLWIAIKNPASIWKLY